MQGEKTREGALAALAALAADGGQAVQPFLLPLLPQVLEAYGDAKVGRGGTAACACRACMWHYACKHAACFALGSGDRPAAHCCLPPAHSSRQRLRPRAARS